jgi:hypothetical protein
VTTGQLLIYSQGAVVDFSGSSQICDMDERDVIECFGPPEEIVDRKGTMRPHAWRCCDCAELTKSVVPIPAPAPCVRCGGIWFKVAK